MTRMWRHALALLALGLSPAYAEECASLSEAKATIREAGATDLRVLSHDQLQFARGLYAASPPSSKYPDGDHAWFAKLPDKSAIIVFVNGDRGCSMLLAPEFTQLLIDLEASF